MSLVSEAMQCPFVQKRNVPSWTKCAPLCLWGRFAVEVQRRLAVVSLLCLTSGANWCRDVLCRGRPEAVVIMKRWECTHFYYSFVGVSQTQQIFCKQSSFPVGNIIYTKLVHKTYCAVADQRPLWGRETLGCCNSCTTSTEPTSGNCWGSLHHQQGKGESAQVGGERTRSRGRALHQLSGGTFWQQNQKNHCASESVIAQMAPCSRRRKHFLENCSVIKSDWVKRYCCHWASKKYRYPAKIQMKRTVDKLFKSLYKSSGSTKSYGRRIDFCKSLEKIKVMAGWYSTER